MLHAERKRLKEMAEAEAKGEDVWTVKFGRSVRVKIFYALRDAGAGRTLNDACDAAQRKLVETLGTYQLMEGEDLTPAKDFVKYLHTCPDEMIPSVIEAAMHGLRIASRAPWNVSAFSSVPRFRSAIKSILDRHRILWDLVDEEMIELRSKELHSGVVEPAVRLLAGRPDLAAVEKAYQDALREVSEDRPEDAITDAGTALQEMLRACGCKGNSIGDLAGDARSKDLLAPHDTRLAAGIQDIMEWVGADRSEKGDTHKAGSPSKDDAWLTIHVVGALIVRLAAGKR